MLELFAILLCYFSKHLLLVLCFDISKLYIFTARAYARAVLGVVILSVRLSVRPSVCLSVTRVHCDKTK